MGALVLHAFGDQFPGSRHVFLHESWCVLHAVTYKRPARHLEYSRTGPGVLEYSGGGGTGGRKLGFCGAGIGV